MLGRGKLSEAVMSSLIEIEEAIGNAIRGIFESKSMACPEPDILRKAARAAMAEIGPLKGTDDSVGTNAEHSGELATWSGWETFKG